MSGLLQDGQNTPPVFRYSSLCRIVAIFQRMSSGLSYRFATERVAPPVLPQPSPEGSPVRHYWLPILPHLFLFF